MKFINLRKKLASAIAFILIFSFVAQSAVLVNDTFADADSQNQALPDSIRIFNGRAGTVRTDAAGSVTFNTTNAGGSEGFWGFFTDGAPINLGVGDKLVTSVNFTAQNFNATNNAADLRFGVFDSKGTRTTANTTGGLNSPTFSDDTGYATRLAGTAASNTPPFTLHRRTTVPGATDPLVNILGAEYTPITPVTGSSRAPLADNTPYTFTFTVERLSAIDTRLTVSITNGGFFNINSTATESSSTPNTTFDWFGFRVPNGLFSEITFTQWRAEYIPAAPVITSQPTPSNQTVSVGANVSYSVAATGNNLTYQWRRNGIAIDPNVNPSAATATLNLTNVQTSDSGTYDVVISNESGSVISDGVTLNVTSGPVDPAPVITDQPDDTVVVIGSPATLSVTATGNNLFYQWYKNGVLINGATGSTLNFPSAQLSDSGVYTVVVSNSGGTVTSTPARLTVVSPITAIGFEPPNGATEVCIDTALRITFNQTPVPGTSGLIRVYRADGTLFDTIDMSIDTVPGVNVPGNQSVRNNGGASTNQNYYPIIVRGNTASIYLHQKLEYNQTYYVLMDAGPIVDENGAPFAGVSDPNAWRFTTRTTAPAAGTTQLTVSANGLSTNGTTPADFCTVQGAIDFVPANNPQRVTINVLNGTYEEIVYVRSNKRFVTVRGESRDGVVIQYANNENLNSGTTPRALFGVDAPDFNLETLTVYNTTSKLNASGQTRQAEAFRGNNDRITIDHVNLKSFQDTLMLQSQGTQGGFVNETYIEGDVDFTWGAGTAYFRNTELKDNNPGTGNTNAYYSQIRNPQGKHGNVYVNCRLTRASTVPDNTAWLSRIDPDDYPYSEVIWIDSLMDRHIRPEGWRIDNPSLAPTPENYPNIRFWEYNSRDINTGLPIDCSQRHPISRNDCNNPLTAEEADFYRNPTNVLGWTPVFSQTYSISGQITNGGIPLQGVTVTLSGGSTASTVTDASGNYSFTNLTSNANYTLTSSLSGYTFSPASVSVNNLSTNQTAVNFATADISYESDSAPKPSGDSGMQSNDVIQVERYLNELDVPNITPNEFQRADAAPRTALNDPNTLLLGDGVINSGDVIQARRYLNELDPLTLAGGPVAPTTSPQATRFEMLGNVFGKGLNKQREITSAPEAPQATVLHIENATGSAGNQVTVNLRVDPDGTESQISTALLFNTSQLTFSGFAPGNTTAATQSCNLTATAGRIRCSAGAFTSNLSGTSDVIGEIQPTANQILIKVIFTINAGVASGTVAPITFDSPSASNELAQSSVPSTQAGTVTVLAPTAATVSVSGHVTSPLRRGISGVNLSLTDSDGNTRTTVSTAGGYYQFTDVQVGKTYIISATGKRFTFSQPVQVLNVNEETNQINFIANSEKRLRVF